MAFGFGRLRLSPDAFWAMTPLELAAAAGPGRSAAEAPDRSALTALMARFPDRPLSEEETLDERTDRSRCERERGP